MNEAHIEHAIGLIQHQHFNAVKLDRAALHVIHQTPWRGDQNIDTTAQFVDLRLHADTTENGHGLQWQMAAISDHALFHLGGQLARGCQNQRAHLALAAVAAMVHQALQQRQSKAGGFAGAGLRCCHDIAAGENGGNGLRLDRGRGGVLLLVNRAQQFGHQAEILKRHGKSPW